MQEAFVHCWGFVLSTCCLYLFRVRGRITRIARVMPGAHTIRILGVSIMNPDRAITSTVGKEIKKSSWDKKWMPQYILRPDIILFPSCTCKQLCRGQRRERKKKTGGVWNSNPSFIASACWRTVRRWAIIFVFSTVPLKVTQELVWTGILEDYKQTPRPVVLFLYCPQ